MWTPQKAGRVNDQQICPFPDFYGSQLVLHSQHLSRCPGGRRQNRKGSTPPVPAMSLPSPWTDHAPTMAPRVNRPRRSHDQWHPDLMQVTDD